MSEKPKLIAFDLGLYCIFCVHELPLCQCTCTNSYCFDNINQNFLMFGLIRRNSVYFWLLIYELDPLLLPTQLALGIHGKLGLVSEGTNHRKDFHISGNCEMKM